MNKKVLGTTLVLLTVAILAAPLLGTAEACCCRGRWRKPTIATVEYSIEVWPVLPLPANYEQLTGDNIQTGYRNLPTFGIPPFIDSLPTPPLPWDLYGSGGFKLAITVGGEDFELFAAVQKKILLFAVYTDGGSVEISKWSFTIVDEGDAIALGAVGDTLEGWLIMRNYKTVVTSTAGTGIFNGARLIGDLTTTAYPAVTPAGNLVFFTVAVGSGHIVFPRGFP
jgi:hypothetical protein